MWEKISISIDGCLTNALISTPMKLLLILNMKQSFLLKVFYLFPVERKRIFSFYLLFFIKKLPLKMYFIWNKGRNFRSVRIKESVFIFSSMKLANIYILIIITGFREGVEVWTGKNFQEAHLIIKSNMSKYASYLIKQLQI